MWKATHVRLLHYLASDLAPDDCMSLSNIDGFLTAIVLSPEHTPFDGWLPAIWGHEEPRFVSDEERRLVVGSIIGRHNEIAAYFDANAGSVGPNFFDRVDGQISTAGWAKGFFDAIALHREAWEPLINHPEARVLLALLLLLDGDSDLREADDDPDVWDKISEVAPHTILTCVSGIHSFWNEMRNRYPVVE